MAYVSATRICTTCRCSACVAVCIYTFRTMPCLGNASLWTRRQTGVMNLQVSPCSATATSAIPQSLKVRVSSLSGLAYILAHCSFAYTNDGEILIPVPALVPSEILSHLITAFAHIHMLDHLIIQHSDIPAPGTHSCAFTYRLLQN